MENENDYCPCYRWSPGPYQKMDDHVSGSWIPGRMLTVTFFFFCKEDGRRCSFLGLTIFDCSYFASIIIIIIIIIK